MTIGYVVFFAGIGAYTFWNATIKLIDQADLVFLHMMPIFTLWIFSIRRTIFFSSHRRYTFNY